VKGGVRENVQIRNVGHGKKGTRTIELWEGKEMDVGRLTDDEVRRMMSLVQSGPARSGSRRI